MIKVFLDYNLILGNLLTKIISSEDQQKMVKNHKPETSFSYSIVGLRLNSPKPSLMHEIKSFQSTESDNKNSNFERSFNAHM